MHNVRIKLRPVRSRTPPLDHVNELSRINPLHWLVVTAAGHRWRTFGDSLVQQIMVGMMSGRFGGSRAANKRPILDILKH